MKKKLTFRKLLWLLALIWPIKKTFDLSKKFLKQVIAFAVVFDAGGFVDLLTSGIDYVMVVADNQWKAFTL